LLLAVLICGSVILGAAIFTWAKDLIGYNDGTSRTSGYNYDNTYDYLTEHEEIVLNRMNTGLALVCGAAFGLGYLNKVKGTHESDDNADSQTESQIHSKTSGEEMTDCPICGEKTNPAHMFCRHCGAKFR